MHTRRLLWVAPLTVLAALRANGIVQLFAHGLFPLTRTFSHLMVGADGREGAGAVGAACLVVAMVARPAGRSVALTQADPRTSTAGILSLMGMHVVDALLCVGLLTTVPRIGTARGGPGRDAWVATQGGA